jgi:cytochrome c oxidase subunit 3
MQLSTLVIALLTAVLVWTLLVRRLSAKPWIQAGAIDAAHDTGPTAQPAAKVGLWIFLGVITSLFALFFTAYMMRMDPHHTAGVTWVPFDKPAILWLNTLFLILGSLAMQWARTGESHGRINTLRTGLTASGFCIIGFLVGQIIAWNQVRDAEFFALTNPAVGFFYLLTAVHGLHILGGLWVWAGATLRIWRDGQVTSGSLTVELCTVYWHYLLLVWLILFGLLLST